MNKEEADLIIAEQNKSREEILKAIADCEKCYSLARAYRNDNEKLKAQIEKMKCCVNCKYGYCGTSSISTDENGNKTFHNWNKEKQEYCDIGKNGKYQCWELAE